MVKKSLIIGKGQIGTSLQKVLKCDIRDKEPLEGEYDILHIAFPYSKNFVKQVKSYQKYYQPKYTVIHSTVPVGTSKKCNAYHSPVRGMHPKLEESMRVFTTYLAPPSAYLKKYFESAGMQVKLLKNPENTEAGKLWSTTAYGWNIILQKEIYRYCKENNLDFDIVYKSFTESYNSGYKELGRENVTRPVLRQIEGPIKGTCIIPNCKLLRDKVSETILKFNKEY